MVNIDPRALAIQSLARCIAGLEGMPSAANGRNLRSGQPGVLPLGLEALDDHLPGGGLMLGACHDIAPAAHGDGPAARGFALALMARALARRSGVAVLWCRTARSEFGRPYGPGLEAAGLSGPALLTLTVRKEADVLWALEQALRARALAAVLGEVTAPPLAASRRLVLAAAEGETPCLLLRAPGEDASSAARTRWRVAAMASAGDPFDAAVPGRARWRLSLDRCRAGRPGAWSVEWEDETHRFRLAAALADRPAAARARGRAAGDGSGDGQSLARAG